MLQDRKLISGNSCSMGVAAANGNRGRIRIDMVLASEETGNDDPLPAEATVTDTECAIWSAHMAIVCCRSWCADV
jgi:hypothetical protein